MSRKGEQQQEQNFPNHLQTIILGSVIFSVEFTLITISGNLPSVGGGSDEPEDKERDAEEEKLRQEAIKRAEEERRVKHKKFEEEREGIRQGIRDKVGGGGIESGSLIEVGIICLPKLRV